MASNEIRRNATRFMGGSPSGECRAGNSNVWGREGQIKLWSYPRMPKGDLSQARHEDSPGERRRLRPGVAPVGIGPQQALAGAPGIEPGMTGPKPVALPLGYAPTDAPCERGRNLVRKAWPFQPAARRHERHRNLCRRMAQLATLL